MVKYREVDQAMPVFETATPGDGFLTHYFSKFEEVYEQRWTQSNYNPRSTQRTRFRHFYTSTLFPSSANAVATYKYDFESGGSGFSYLDEVWGEPENGTAKASADEYVSEEFKARLDDESAGRRWGFYSTNSEYHEKERIGDDDYYLWVGGGGVSGSFSEAVQRDKLTKLTAQYFSTGDSQWGWHSNTLSSVSGTEQSSYTKEFGLAPIGTQSGETIDHLGTHPYEPGFHSVASTRGSVQPRIHPGYHGGGIWVSPSEYSLLYTPTLYYSLKYSQPISLKDVLSAAWVSLPKLTAEVEKDWEKLSAPKLVSTQPPSRYDTKKKTKAYNGKFVPEEMTPIAQCALWADNVTQPYDRRMKVSEVKYYWQSNDCKPHTFEWMEIFTPFDDPTTPENEGIDGDGKIEIKYKQFEAGGDKKSEPIVLNPASEGRLGKYEVVSPDILPDDEMSGVVGDLISPLNKDPIQRHFVSPKVTTEISDPHVVVKVAGVSEDTFNRLFRLDAVSGTAETVPGEPLKRRISRSDATVVKLNLVLKETEQVVRKMSIWIVWTAPTVERLQTPKFENFEDGSGGAYFQAPNQPFLTWRFVFAILPIEIITGPDCPDLKGFKAFAHDVPGAHLPYPTYPDDPAYRADSAVMKWDTSRQMRWGITDGDFFDFVFYPTNPVQGNDDAASDVPPPAGDGDEDNIPYVAKTGMLAHPLGSISSFDGPSLGRPRKSTDVDGQVYFKDVDFKEFARVQLWDGQRKKGNFWFRISDYILWHHYFRAKFKDNWFTPDVWENFGSEDGQP